MTMTYEAALNDYVRSRGFKMTGQRREIVDYIFHHSEHFSPDELFVELRRLYPRLGRATVYRTLKLLKDAALAVSVDFGSGPKKFEHIHNRPHHDHMICTSCGKTIEFLEPQIEALQTRAARKNGFVPHDHRLEIYGLCASCEKKTDKKKG